MRVLSLNVGRPRLVMYNGASVSTAIFKDPVEGPRQLTETNLDGDRQANLEVHGGVDKAVYAYPSEHYSRWSEELERDDLKFGQFGENLTVDGLLETDVRVGNRYAIGSTVLEVCQPRVPCRNLAIRMNDPSFPKRFLKSRRSGFYLRVIETGQLQAGDSIELVEPAQDAFTIHELYEILFGDRVDRKALMKAIETPKLSEQWRGWLSERLNSSGN